MSSVVCLIVSEDKIHQDNDKDKTSWKHLIVVLNAKQRANSERNPVTAT